jgi:amino-acid N-acetyltransferase
MPETEDIAIAFANASDEQPIKQLLAEAALPYEDIGKPLQHFLLAKRRDSLIGVVGLEVLDDIGLLRSLAVASAHRGQGIGTLLYERMAAYAHLQGVKQLYVLTTTAEGFFNKRGFDKVDRSRVPEPICATEEFRTLCPASAVCMTKKLDEGAQHYPKEILRLRQDVPGAMMWAVVLEHTMLTYFEVRPYSRFEAHTHESEQITLVLQGELYFETGRKMICVKEGEVIAIPSGVPHAAFTREQSVRAVDAWSPVMGQYKTGGD